VNFAESDIAQLASLLRRPVNDDLVVNSFGWLIFKIRRSAYYGFLTFDDNGVDVVFNEAPWVIPEAEIVDPKRLYLCAFHFHRAGHSGYSQYVGQLPNGIVFGDSKTDLLKKMGEPYATGGGGISSVPPKLPIPPWLKYKNGEAILHFQLDDADHIEMVTLMPAELPPSSTR
jgi:hypothetical protein